MENQNQKQRMKGKFRTDNINKKIRCILLKNLEIFINHKISEIHNNNIGHGKTIKRIRISKINIIENSRIIFKQMLLKKTLLEIFTENIKPISILYPSDTNKKLIEELLNEKDDDKRNYFKNLFNLTFLDYLEHFTTKRVIEELQGLKTFLDIKNDENELKRLKLDDKEYLNSFEDFLNNYEEKLKLLNKKRKRSYSKFMHKLINIKI